MDRRDGSQSFLDFVIGLMIVKPFDYAVTNIKTKSIHLKLEYCSQLIHVDRHVFTWGNKLEVI